MTDAPWSPLVPPPGPAPVAWEGSTLARRSLSGNVAISHHTDLDDLAHDWAELCRRVGSPPFLWPQWHRHWRDAFATGPLHYLVARDGPRVTGVVAFEERRGILVAPTHPLHSPSLQPVVEDRDVLRRLLDHLAAMQPDGLHWDELPLGPEELQIVRDSVVTALPYGQLETHQRAPFIDLTLGWETIRERLGHQYWKNDRRCRRRAQEQGRLRHQTVTDHIGERLFARCLAVEASGWKGAQGTAIATTPAARQFFRDVADWAAAEGWLRLELLWLDDDLLAFEFNLHHLDVQHSLKVGFDERFRALGPGKLLSNLVMARAVADPTLTRSEWGVGENPYKLRWADGAVPLHQLRLYPAGPRGWTRWKINHIRRRSRQLVSESLPEPVADRIRVIRAKLRGTDQGSEDRS